MSNSLLLEAIYNETLRVVSGALSTRNMVKITHIGGKILSSHNTILIPFRQLQISEEGFASDSSKFDADRFLRNKTLGSSVHFRTFGGGVDYCPGRFLAKQEMFVFVATGINRFEITLSASSAKAQIFPILYTLTPSLGINSHVAGMDILSISKM
jgi:cytochrome P450